MHIWVVLLKKLIIKKIKHTKKQYYVLKCSVMDLIMARAAREITAKYLQLPLAKAQRKSEMGTLRQEKKVMKKILRTMVRCQLCINSKLGFHGLSSTDVPDRGLL